MTKASAYILLAGTTVLYGTLIVTMLFFSDIEASGLVKVLSSLTFLFPIILAAIIAAQASAPRPIQHDEEEI